MCVGVENDWLPVRGDKGVVVVHVCGAKSRVHSS
jgi:hypothetical protein